MKKEFKLPLFNGFYESIHCYNNEDILAENENVSVDYIIDNFEYKKYEKDYCINYINELYKYFNVVFKKYGISDFNFVEITYPKEYNFLKNELFVSSEINEELFFDSLLELINNNKNEFKNFIKERHESYPGFISFYSDNSDEWYKKVNCKDLSLLNEVELSTILSFLIDLTIENNNDTYQDIIYSFHYTTCEKMDIYSYISFNDNK